MCEHVPMARVTRAQAKAQTRRRLLDEAQRLFRERGYAATSLEQIAEAANVTKGAIYGHFSSKEELLGSAIEATPTPDFGSALNDVSRPVGERLAEFGRAIASDAETSDAAGLAVSLEFMAALLRNPDARARYAEDLARRLRDLAEADDDEPLPGIAPVDVWAIGHALLIGLQIQACLAPEIVTPELFERAVALLAGLYPAE
jgi:AcrR family transcriptional regulator